MVPDSVRKRQGRSLGHGGSQWLARKLCRERLTIKPGYEFGYLIGATTSDATVGENYVSLVVNDQEFAQRCAVCLTAATGLPARLGLSVSANVPFLAALAQVVGARFTPVQGRASHLVVADGWPSRGTSAWVEVRDVHLRRTDGTKPFTLYDFRLAPYPSFLVNGHLAREPW